MMSWQSPRKVVWIAFLALLVGLGTLSWNWRRLEVQLAEYRLRHADSPELCGACIARLLRLGEPGVDRLGEVLHSLDAEAIQKLSEPLREQVLPAAETHPHIPRLLIRFPDAPPATQELLLSLIPAMSKRDDAKLKETCLKTVLQALESPVAETRVLALRLALQPELNLQQESRRCLKDPSALVRTTALLLLGTTQASLSDEELFAFLHDPDLQVRQTAEATLYAHGRTAREIVLGYKLTDPQATERLQLLVDLSRERERDIEPWLARLARDPEPAVRAGAVRLAVEARLPFASWIDTLAKEDADPLVQSIARYYRSQNSTLTPVGGP